MISVDDLFRGVPLGDARRNDRAVILVRDLIQGQIQGEHGGSGVGHRAPWNEVKAAFCFYNNPAISLRALLEPCRRGLAQLLAPGTHGFIAHDVSSVNYSRHHAKQERIPIGDGQGLGYELFTALVLDTQGRPLGPLVQELQTIDGCLSSEAEEPIPFVSHYEQAERALYAASRTLPRRHLVHLIDREFDDLQLERLLDSRGQPFVIRAQHLNRRVLWRGQEMSLEQVISRISLQDAGETEKDGTSYRVWQGYTRVRFHGLSHRGCAKRGAKPRKGRAILLRVIVSELRPVTGRALRWVLLTNWKASVSQVVQAYIWRWKVERLFFLIKVGFHLEDWRQESGPGLARRLSLSMLAAMVLHQMQASDDPETKQALVTIAKLGGWLGRKGDSLGPIVLMRGMMLIIGLLTAYEEHGEQAIRRLAEQVGRWVGFSSRAPD